VARLHSAIFWSPALVSKFLVVFWAVIVVHGFFWPVFIIVRWASGWWGMRRG
jgi:hypothetical protein